jgi:hypothetical protein
MNTSEIAHLREQVTLEYEAMIQGMSGFAEGSAMHAFISARMARIEGYHSELTREVGETEATQIICDLYNQTIR